MNDIAKTRSKLKQIEEGHLGQMADRVELDHEVQMARADLYKIAKYAIKLHEMLKGVSEIQGIEGWQQAKITKAADYLSSVYHNMDYEMSPMNPENAEGQMDQMAFDLASESKEAVKEEWELISKRPKGDILANRPVKKKPSPEKKMPDSFPKKLDPKDILKKMPDSFPKKLDPKDILKKMPDSFEEAGYTDKQRSAMDDMVKSVNDKDKDDPGMERDRTQGLDPEFSKRVQDQNKKNMKAESKFSDWSKS
jgi:hypothetical protein